MIRQIIRGLTIQQRIAQHCDLLPRYRLTTEGTQKVPDQAPVIPGTLTNLVVIMVTSSLLRLTTESTTPG